MEERYKVQRKAYRKSRNIKAIKRKTKSEFFKRWGAEEKEMWWDGCRWIIKFNGKRECGDKNET